MRCAEDAVADFEARIARWCGEDCAGEFGAADPRQGGLVLVFTLDLEDVEEVCACGVDLDEVFVGGWGWGWYFGYF